MLRRTWAGRNAVIWGVALVAALAIGFAFGGTARAVPLLPSEAPVYAIDSYPFQKAPALLRWRSVLQRDEALMARANPEDCRDGKPRIACAAKAVLELEDKLQDTAPDEQVEAVYAYFNAISYKEHDPKCGIDCWKTRLDFVADGEGDCGDHALAEYFTLKRLGFKERDLQLIIAQLPGFEDSFKGGHVVLRVRAGDDYYILDNRRTVLADLSGLGAYKVLAGVNADSVQIYNLVTPAPPPGFVADTTQVAALITSPGVATQPPEAPQEVLVAAATPAPQPEPQPVIVAQPTPQPQPEPAPVVVAQSTPQPQPEPAPVVVAQPAPQPQPEPAPVVVAEAQPQPEPTPVVAETEPQPASSPVEPETPQPILIASVAAPQPTVVAAPAAPASVEEEAETMCMQSAQLADWNPMMPCTEVVKSYKMVIKAKTIIGAEPPKSLDDKPVEPIKVADAPKAPEPKIETPKAAEPKVVTKPAVVAPTPAPEPKTEPVVEATQETEEEDSGACTQGGTLADWNPDLPCTSGLKIEFKD